MLKVRFLCFFIQALFFAALPCFGKEIVFEDVEGVSLKNIRQLSFSSMGFEKAGEAYFSPDGQTIIFQAVPKGQANYQIYTLALDESVPKMVSTGKGACTCAYFRPDGEKIIFASSHEAPDVVLKSYKWDLTPYMNIYEANPDGSNLVPLTFGPAYHAECAYSPDGSRIVYASNESGSMNIYTMNTDGSDVQSVTSTNYCYNGGPFFSPNGKKIIFRADRETPDYLQIYEINEDGTGEKQLTRNGAVNWAPYWHPNGDVIAFTTSLHGHSRYELYLLNVETGLEHRLTYSSTFDGLAAFSNDGSKILWTSKRGGDDACHVFIADFIMPLEVLSPGPL